MPFIVLESTILISLWKSQGPPLMGLRTHWTLQSQAVSKAQHFFFRISYKRQIVTMYSSQSEEVSSNHPQCILKAVLYRRCLAHFWMTGYPFTPSEVTEEMKYRSNFIQYVQNAFLLLQSVLKLDLFSTKVLLTELTDIHFSLKY